MMMAGGGPVFCSSCSSMFPDLLSHELLIYEGCSSELREDQPCHKHQLHIIPYGYPTITKKKKKKKEKIFQNHRRKRLQIVVDGI